MVESGVLDEDLGAVDAAVVAERVHRHARGGLQDQHVSQRVEEDGPRLTQAVGDLGDLPCRVHGVGISGRRDTGARCWEGGCGLGQGYRITLGILLSLGGAGYRITHQCQQGLPLLLTRRANAYWFVSSCWEVQVRTVPYDEKAFVSTREYFFPRERGWGGERYRPNIYIYIYYISLYGNSNPHLFISLLSTN